MARKRDLKVGDIVMVNEWLNYGCDESNCIDCDIIGSTGELTDIFARGGFECEVYFGEYSQYFIPRELTKLGLSTRS